MASRGKTVQLDHMYSADFETCDAYEQEENANFPDQRVWLGGFKNLETGKSSYFYNSSDFMCAILARGDNQNTEYAFHNMKFDGSFIIPELFNLGYTCSMEKPEPGQFSVLIDDRNAWYTIQIQVTKRRHVTIWDSVKLFPTPLEYLPEVYGTPTHKIHEDEAFYTARREAGHVPTDEEMSYFENDLAVLFEALNAHIKIYGLHFRKTQASQAFSDFEKSFPCWRYRFPALETDVDILARRAYWGGISYAAKQHAGVDQANIGVYDINSSYPFQLATRKMPYGDVLQKYGEGKHPDMSKFWVAEALVIFTLKPYKVPCIPTKSISEGKPVTLEHWLADSEGLVRMTFCSIDYKTMHESYDIQIVDWVWSIHWAQKVHKELTAYILQNNDDKVKYKNMAKHCKDPEQKLEYLSKSQRAKINNNSFYGKFGEDIIKRGKTPHPDEYEGVRYVCDREEIQPMRKRRFLPLAIATTAWGRQQLVQMANTLQEDFLYCDTDSIHYRIEGQKCIEDSAAAGVFTVSDVDLGAWKYEGHFDRGRYLRAKCYYEENFGHIPEVTCAGLPSDKHTGARSKTRSCCTWENFHIGLNIPGGNGRLRTVRTRTGNKLVSVDFNITEAVSFIY